MLTAEQLTAGWLPHGWIVGDGHGVRWRTWHEGNPCWTFDRKAATRYARREDAEAVHAEDEDVWLVVPYCSTPDPIAALLAPDEALRQIAAGISRDVAEWPDRTSPEDQPDMLLITQEELEGVVLDALIAAGTELAKRRDGV